MDQTPPKSHTTLYDPDITETILYLIDLYVNDHPLQYAQSKFIHIIINNVFDLLKLTIAEVTDINEYPNIIETIYENIQYYFKTIGIPRSYKSSLIIEKVNIEDITMKLEKVDEVKQPPQKSEQWHIDRHKMITASTAWEALDTEAAQNRLIYRKCCPINMKKCLHININSPLHHGQKYEPISVLFYENLYKTKIKEFGCIHHPKYSFIGASPDGINIKKDNPRFGRMLEIKNIVNREINGIPKKQYWIQMQQQMEVCNLNECDFLETRFKEYSDEQAFLDDGGFDCSKIKGIIICFHSHKGPIYKYSPFLSISEETKCRKWMDDCMEHNKTMTWVRNIYWVLDEYSCILVPRNQSWFKSALPQFKKTWQTILHDREHGYLHRKPKKKEKNIILKVRTESFEKTIMEETNQRKVEIQESAI